jgi:tetratricopeptide (TPR) repeat protein
VRCFDRAIELNRNDAVRGLFHSHPAEALNLLGRFQEAFTDVSRCLEVAPNDDEALYAVSLIELLHGRWREAWPRYERRIALKIGIPEGFCAPTWPPWRGERLRDQLLVLRGEQGLGDHLLFSCFGAHLAKLGYRIALWTKPSLEPPAADRARRGTRRFRYCGSRGDERAPLDLHDECAGNSPMSRPKRCPAVGRF